MTQSLWLVCQSCRFRQSYHERVPECASCHGVGFLVDEVTGLPPRGAGEPTMPPQLSADFDLGAIIDEWTDPPPSPDDSEEGYRFTPEDAQALSNRIRAATTTCPACDALRTEIAALRAALEDLSYHVRHSAICPASALADDDGECTCGYEASIQRAHAVLQPARPAAPERTE